MKNSIWIIFNKYFDFQGFEYKSTENYPKSFHVFGPYSTLEEAQDAACGVYNDLIREASQTVQAIRSTKSWHSRAAKRRVKEAA